MFSQPFMEAHLLEVAKKHSRLTHHWGCDLIAVEDKGDHVVATTRDSMGGDDKIKAKFVVGCDGANSKVREELGIKMEDLGFFYECELSWIQLDSIGKLTVPLTRRADRRRCPKRTSR